MEQAEIKRRIQAGRDFLKSHAAEKTDFVSDQDQKLPQPPLTKAPMTDHPMDLPKEFSTLPLELDFLSLLTRRCSSRVYTQESMSLLQLSFLLWATQGVKEIRGKRYATLRPVPCGGARHPFETYLLVQQVEGLEPGVYHYLPIEHQLELLAPEVEMGDLMNGTLCGQAWAAKANVTFYWSLDCYRVEWRYGISAHRGTMLDLGHVGENLYLACTALGLGTCGIGYYDQALCDTTFRLDGNEEFTAYSQSVGTIRQENAGEEQSFYSFVKEENL